MFATNDYFARVVFRRVVLCSSLALLVCASPLAAQSGVDLQGKTVDPIVASKGKIVVLVFVRTDCPISNRYAPLLQQLSVEFSDTAKFWLVYPDRSTTAQQISSHLKRFRYSLQALHDPERSLVKSAGATITPEAAVFDSHGKLLYHGRIDNLYLDAGRAHSAATTHELRDAIEFAARGKSP